MQPDSRKRLRGYQRRPSVRAADATASRLRAWTAEALAKSHGVCDAGQLRPGVLCAGTPVTDAHDCGFNLSEPPKAGPGLLGMSVEDTKPWLVVVGHDGVARDQDAVLGEEHRDTARRVSRRSDARGGRPPAEPVSVVDSGIE